MEKIRINHTLCLIIILVSAVFIYFYNLGAESLLAEEYLSLHAAGQPLRDIIFGSQKINNLNPVPSLYEIIMHFWLKNFGRGEFAQRSFSAFLGIISLYLIYRLARLLFDEKIGLLSSFFAMLSSSWFALFRQNTYYSLFICLSLSSLYLFFCYLKNKQSRLYCSTLLITNICLVYTHYFGFLVIFIELLFSAWEILRARRWVINMLLVCFWVCFAYSPWYANLLYHIGREPVMYIKPYYSDLGLRLFSLFLLLFSDFHIEWDPLLTLIYLPLFIIGWLTLNKAERAKFKYLPLCLALLFFIPFITIYLVTLSDKACYYVPFSFPLFILLAFGIQQIYQRKRGRMFLFPIAAFILTFNFFDFSASFRNPLHEDWKKAVQYIKKIPNYKNEEMVFVFQIRHHPPVFAYYYWGEKTASSFINNIAYLESQEENLSLIDAKHKIYLISNDPREEKFFQHLSLLPDNAWIWLFRYHASLAPLYMRLKNNGRYFLHQIPLNQEMPQIDLFLLKKIKQ
jgi:4-amino-4-deoxy-L-arabinose transferase-like glycosyltransferase